MTLYESAAAAVVPWNSLDAESEHYQIPPKQSIDICLSCTHCESYCDVCSEWNTAKVGRPRAKVDREALSELLRLKMCNADICAALGINKRTLQRLKKTMN